MGSKDYEPIDCGLHDRLEEYSTLGRPVRIEFQGPDGEELVTEGRITDVSSKAGAEYLTMHSGGTIRLDRIRSVDGRPATTARARD